jgi:hypothetical protein
VRHRPRRPEKAFDNAAALKSFGRVHAALISHSNAGGTRLRSLIALSAIDEIPHPSRSRRAGLLGLLLFQQFGAFTGVCGQISSIARKLMGSAFYKLSLLVEAQWREKRVGQG